MSNVEDKINARLTIVKKLLTTLASEEAKPFDAFTVGRAYNTVETIQADVQELIQERNDARQAAYMYLMSNKDTAKNVSESLDKLFKAMPGASDDSNSAAASDEEDKEDERTCIKPRKTYTDDTEPYMPERSYMSYGEYTDDEDSRI